MKCLHAEGDEPLEFCGGSYIAGKWHWSRNSDMKNDKAGLKGQMADSCCNLCSYLYVLTHHLSMTRINAHWDGLPTKCIQKEPRIEPAFVLQTYTKDHKKMSNMQPSSDYFAHSFHRSVISICIALDNNLDSRITREGFLAQMQL